ncbi:F-box domain-containing protein [Favolaschia claudopus]|uniref:F-box domain-containing protein n=1 Tax=Favolaschia claudopus TaxID=2862362 RepID=A0AAW0EDM8_9AGAR
MEGQLTELQTQINLMDLAPCDCCILTLPPEITSEIFGHCSPTQRVGDVVNVYEAPLLLTQVCGAWRQIAISTPALWTTFDITLKHPGDLPKLGRIAQTWFERAKNFPLVLRIRGPLKENKTLGRLIKTFCNHSGQMRSLEFYTGGEDLETIQLNIPGVLDLAILQRLSIRLTDDWDCERRQGIKIFETAPNLQEVLISDTLPSFLSLPWQQLTTITAEMVSVTTCMKLMRLTPILVKCFLSPFLVGDAIDVARRERLYLPQLQHLTLFSTTTTGFVLDSITLPALQTLEIRRADRFDAENFDCFLERSSPPLQKLVITVLDSAHGTSLILSPSFTTLPLVELKLWILTGSFAVHFFSFLEGGDNFLPQLRSLSFMHSPFIVQNVGRTELFTLLQLAAQPITRRWETIPGCTKLRTFHVIEEATDDSSRYFEEDLIPFNRLCARGMDVYIGSRSGLISA